MPRKEPNFRFAGFAGEWETRKLGEIGSVAMNKRIYKDQTTEDGEIPFYKIGTFGKEADAFISRDLFEELKEKHSYPKKGDLLLSASGSIGRVVEYKGEDAYFQDSNIVWLDHEEETLVNKFLKQFYNIVRWDGIEGTTIKRLYNKNILNTKITFPTSEEQEKIGELFEVLDGLIEKQEAYIQTLEEMKKGFLQGLFPQKGQTRPDLRFEGFEGDWEEKKISEIAEITTGKTPPTSNSSYYSDEGYMFVTPSDIEELVVKDTERRLTDEGILKTQIAKKGSILMTCIASIGKNTLVTEDVGFNQQINSVYLKDGYDKYFFLTMSFLISKKMKQYASSGMMQIINKTEFSSINILLPSLAEQEKIGEFFEGLDTRIDLENRKLRELEDAKKALLQNCLV